MVIVWRLRGNIIRTALCWIVRHNVHSQQHTYMSSSYRSNRLGLSHWDPYAVSRGGCLELYYCNMVEWFWCDSSLISTTNWFRSVLWHCWFDHLVCKNRPQNDLLCVELDVKPYTLTHSRSHFVALLFRHWWVQRCRDVLADLWEYSRHLQVSLSRWLHHGRRHPAVSRGWYVTHFSTGGIGLHDYRVSNTPGHLLELFLLREIDWIFTKSRGGNVLAEFIYLL